MKNFQCRFWLSGLLLIAIYLSASMVVLGQFECQPGTTTAPTTGSLVAGDASQTGRIVRDGRPSSCTGKTNALQNVTPVVQDSYNFTAPISLTPMCATLDFNHAGCGTATTGTVAYSTYTPGTPNTGIIGDMGFSSTGTGSFSFPVTSGQNFTIVVYDVLETPTNLFCANYTFTITYSNSCRQAGYDRTNDGSADLNYYRPSTGQWFTYDLVVPSLTTNTMGLSGDVPVIGDYDGNGNSEPAVFRPSNSTWYSMNAPGNPVTNFSVTQWGTSGDIPLPGDYDRDGKTDINVWRPNDGNWYTLRSSTSTMSVFHWGTLGDTPYTGDFDGDRVNDFGVTRNTASGPLHQILESNFAQGFFLQTLYGVSNDLLAIGDYDGDAKSDLTVFRPSNGNWYINQSSVVVGSPVAVIHWGQDGDIPQPADYDGDKKTDVAVFRPSTGVWYILRSTDGFPAAFTPPATATDIPASAPYSSVVISPSR
jgi:hypothetical protein